VKNSCLEGNVVARRICVNERNSARKRCDQGVFGGPNREMGGRQANVFRSPGKLYVLTREGEQKDLYWVGRVLEPDYLRG